jgi:hypothetical protein
LPPAPEEGAADAEHFAALPPHGFLAEADEQDEGEADGEEEVLCADLHTQTDIVPRVYETVPDDATQTDEDEEGGVELYGGPPHEAPSGAHADGGVEGGHEELPPDPRSESEQ